MLVTFSCPAYADIMMFGDVAVHLLKLMGHTGTVPGAILADDVSVALERLEAAVELEQQIGENSVDGVEEERAVSLSHRALPLLELLEAAVKTKCNVMWDK